MKAVLISIRPEWCEKIASGQKTIEVRKTKPKLETPFKCYIYCTLAGSNEFWRQNLNRDLERWNREKWGLKKGNVIGEFVCDKIYDCDADSIGLFDRHTKKYLSGSCMNWEQICSYAKGVLPLFGWHISDLVIYDKPKAINEFCFPSEKYCEKGLCGGRPYDQVPNEYGEYSYDCEWKRPLSRPPQSWCYVEEVLNCV